jgi:hypothetical protein
LGGISEVKEIAGVARFQVSIPDLISVRAGVWPSGIWKDETDHNPSSLRA